MKKFELQVVYMIVVVFFPGVFVLSDFALLEYFLWV